MDGIRNVLNHIGAHKSGALQVHVLWNNLREEPVGCVNFFHWLILCKSTVRASSTKPAAGLDIQICFCSRTWHNFGRRPQVFFFFLCIESTGTKLEMDHDHTRSVWSNVWALSGGLVYFQVRWNKYGTLLIISWCYFCPLCLLFFFFWIPLNRSYTSTDGLLFYEILEGLSPILSIRSVD